MTWKKKIAGTAAMFILGFIFILPVLWIVMNSIKTSPEIAADFLALPKSLYLDNFKNAMESMNFLVALKNSVVITLGAMLGGLFVSLPVLSESHIFVGKSHRICICILFSDRSCRFMQL